MYELLSGSLEASSDNVVPPGTLATEVLTLEMVLYALSLETVLKAQTHVFRFLADTDSVLGCRQSSMSVGDEEVTVH